jgi:outer membrane protein assembly factor BamB
MSRTYQLLLLLLAVQTAGAQAADPVKRHAHNWHQWRGPAANGVADNANPPVTWDRSKNIHWKTAIAGEGSATPIIWENQVFLLTAIETDRVAKNPPAPDERAKTRPPGNYLKYVVLCLERSTGKEKWRRVACEQVPHEGRHRTNTFASASPTTDGNRLYVSFGSRGIYCYDMAGTLQWQRDLGEMRTRYGWGEATSPVVHGDSLIINWDHEDQSFIVVLDTGTGETKWKQNRDEPTSWATPLVVEHDGRTQLIVNGTTRVRSHDLSTGELIWQCGGQTVNAIPSPLASDGFVYCMSGYRGSAAYAISLDATGDITETTQPRWVHRRATPYVPSPLLYGSQIYFTAQNTSVLSCLHVETGKSVFDTQRLPGLGNIYASPVAAAGRIYFTDRDGTTVVVKHGPKLEVIATNKLDEPIDASPAIVGKQMFLRGAQNLYCIEE